MDSKAESPSPSLPPPLFVERTHLQTSPTPSVSPTKNVLFAVGNKPHETHVTIYIYIHAHIHIRVYDICIEMFLRTSADE